MKFSQFLIEAKKQEKPPVVFVDPDESIAFPPDTVSAIQRTINKFAKDLEKEYKSAIELVDDAMTYLSVPIPLASLNTRWQQYTALISHAIRELYDARGSNSLTTI